MPNLIGGANGGLLDDSAVLDDGGSPVISDFSDPEFLLRPIEPEIRSRVPELRERQAAFLAKSLGEETNEDFELSKKAVEVAEVFFPPLGLANMVHDAGSMIAQGLLDESPGEVGLGTGLLAMAMLPIPAPAKKSITAGMKEVVKGGPSEFNTMLNAVLKSKNIKTEDVTKEIVPELDKLTTDALAKVEKFGGDVIGAGMSEKSGSQMQNILGNFKGLVDELASINKPLGSETAVQALPPHVFGDEIQAAISNVGLSKGSFSEEVAGDMAKIMGRLINEKGSVDDALKELPLTGASGAPIFESPFISSALLGIKAKIGAEAAALKFAPKLSESARPGINVIDDAVSSTLGTNKPKFKDDDLNVIGDEVQTMISEFGSVEDAIEFAEFDGKFGSEVHDTLVTIFNKNLSSSALAPTDKELTDKFTKQAVASFKAQTSNKQFDDVHDAVVNVTHMDELATSDIDDIATETMGFITSNKHNMDDAFKAAEGEQFIQDVLTELALMKGFNPKQAIQKPLQIKRPPATSEHATQLVSDIQTGIQAIHLPDAAKVDKFLERKGFSLDTLKRRSKLIRNEDIEDLFQLKGAVFDGNVNDVMSQIAQRDVTRTLRKMPKGTAERKEFIETLVRQKEGGFDLPAWHATTKVLGKELAESGEFKLSKVGANYGTKREPAIFMSPSPESASAFGEVIFPLTIKSKNPMIVDLVKLRGAPQGFSVDLTEEVIDAARLAKKDVVILKNIEDNGGLQDQIMVLDPKLIRSIFAKFKDLDSANLGAGIAGVSTLPFAMRANNKDSEAKE